MNVANPSSSRLAETRSPSVITVVALLLGVILRVAFLGAQSLNIDEGWTFIVAIADKGLLEMTSFDGSVDPHPLPFYALYRWLSPWITSADWAFRVPALVCSLIALLLYRELLRHSSLDTQLQRWSFLLFAVLPMNVFFASMARAYSAAQALSIAVLLSYFRCRESATNVRLAVLFVVTALSCCIDLVGLAAVACILIHQVAVWRGRADVRVCLSVVLGIAVSGVYGYLRWRQYASVGGVDQMPQPFEFSRLVDVLMQLTPFGIGQRHAATFPYGYFIYCAFALLTLVILIRAAVATRANGSIHITFWILLLLPLLGQAMVGLMGEGWRLHRRYLVVIVPAFVPIFATGTFLMATAMADRIRRWRAIGATGATWLFHGILILVMLAVPVVVCLGMHLRSGNRADWRSLYRLIGDEIEATDGFLHTYGSPAPGFVIGPLAAYAHMDGKSISPTSIFDPRISLASAEVNITLDHAAGWATEADRRSTAAFLERYRGKRIWVIRSPLSHRRKLRLAPHGELVSSWEAHLVHAELYRIPNHEK